ncbi:MAG: GTP cyclohydrolase I FolE [Terriglobia bacterium]
MSESTLTRPVKALQEASLDELIREVLIRIGEDPGREGLVETPRRLAKALNYLTRGYQLDPNRVLNNALYSVQYDEMVIVRDIDLFSLCEHHMLPFFGKCHVAYIPNEKVIGLSKIARLVDMFARRLQIQERLTCQVAETINQAINPVGVGVVIEAQHLCMIMRGVEKQNSVATTSSMLGAFRQEGQTRLEFLELLRGSKTTRI